ncbi:hypothetical protein RHMOL_Rhmol01G0089600 [Rhododendron molle]|uniref:Uncharacterized protein n=1 Tax=Rhododendron molle TaxID=49168 RepID=A0ACC0PZS9_RHOML|nr:hypothetical protein RHMOL_Rhmol01G0089600 [Rhododendron molle]
MPRTIGKLSCLKKLLVGNNKLSHLPSEIGDLDSLEVLHLRRNNGLRALPESICKLVHLQKLSLTDCNLSHLPSEIDRLISLASLGLGRNRSLTLPDNIWHLTRLNASHLGGCNLSHLPSGIGGLVSLATLNIEENNIYTIPDSISDLPRLGYICLNNCAKLRCLPKLPTRASVYAAHCPLLESLPLELDQLGLMGLSELQHVVSIVVPARDKEVPIWFPYRGRGRNVYFVVPPSPSVKQKILGWILRVLISWAPREASHLFPKLYIQEVICNKIKKQGLSHHFCVCTGVDNVWLMYIPQGYAGLQLEGGDEVEIQLDEYSETLVKNWVIDLIYEADEIDKGNDTLYQVVSI